MTSPTADLSWQDDAKCTEIGGEVWFPEGPRPGWEAKRICDTCPVQMPCLLYGLDADDGIYGGVGAYQRRQMRNGTRPIALPTPRPAPKQVA